MTEGDAEVVRASLRLGAEPEVHPGGQDVLLVAVSGVVVARVNFKDLVRPEVSFEFIIPWELYQRAIDGPWRQRVALALNIFVGAVCVRGKGW